MNHGNSVYKVVCMQNETSINVLAGTSVAKRQKMPHSSVGEQIEAKIFFAH